jgi:adenine-specific DNA-methyltransferase
MGANSTSPVGTPSGVATEGGEGRVDWVTLGDSEEKEADDWALCYVTTVTVLKRLSPPKSCHVYTPPAIATAMVEALGDTPADQWLEPCVGGGVFLEALSKLGVPRERIRAIDLDRTAGSHDSLARTLRGTEFLHWAKSTKERFTRIVANPPYIALHRLPRIVARAACGFRALDETPVSLRANCWYAFLCAGLSLLRREGSICFVLPAAWDYANYARGLNAALESHFCHVGVHRSKVPLFPTVQEGSVVLVATGFLQSPRGAVRKEYSSAEQLVCGLTATQCSPTIVCNGGLSAVVRGVDGSGRFATAGVARLGEVVEISIGAVTGAADYFLFTEHERRERGLPITCFRPVVTHARHLKGSSVTSRHWKALRAAGERVWLFRPPTSLCRHSAVRRYLSLDASHGGCDRSAFKVASRRPWYQTPMPERVDGFVSGMSRNGPWICLKGMAGLSATNTLYVVRFPESWHDDEKAAWALTVLTTEAAAALRAIGREYPDGLVKYEPGDLSELHVRRPRRIKGAFQVYRRAVAALLAGEGSKCRRLADRWFSLEIEAQVPAGVPENVVRIVTENGRA